MKDLTKLYRRAKPSLEALEIPLASENTDVDFDGVDDLSEDLQNSYQTLGAALGTHEELSDVSVIAVESLTTTGEFTLSMQAFINKRISVEADYDSTAEVVDSKPTNPLGLKKKLQAAWETILRLLDSLWNKIKAFYKKFFTTLGKVKVAIANKIKWVNEQPDSTQFVVMNSKYAEADAKVLTDAVAAMKADLASKSAESTRSQIFKMFPYVKEGAVKLDHSYANRSGKIAHKTTALATLTTMEKCADSVEHIESKIVDLESSVAALKKDAKAVTDATEQSKIRKVIDDLSFGMHSIATVLTHFVREIHTTSVSIKVKS